jgi:hypothetical protein
MTNVGEVIGTTIADQNKITQSVVKKGSVTTYFTFGQYFFDIKGVFLKIEEQALNNHFTLDHSVNCVLDSATLQLDTGLGSLSTSVSDSVNKNLTISSKIEMAKFLAGESSTSPSHIAIGTGSTPYSDSQTDLVTISGARFIIKSISNATSKRLIYIEDITDRDLTLREVGLFDALTSGNMWLRWVTSALTMVTSKNYKITIYIDFSNPSSSESLVTDYLYNQARDYLYNSIGSPPTYLEWSNGTSIPESTDTALDGANKERNISTIKRNPSPGTKVEFKTILASSELNSIDITKMGLHVSSTGSNLCTQTRYGLIPKLALFKVQDFSTIKVV